MHSSTSSSRERLPRTGALVSLIVAVVLSLVVIGLLELRMRQAGITPNVHDTKELWASERARASALGDRALILVGDSRMQLDVDLATLAAATGLQPVQLAIDGSHYLPVLEDLADDPEVTGMVLVGAETWKLLTGYERGRGEEWVGFYRNSFRGLWAPAVEAKLKGWVQSWSALYASGIPWQRLWPLLLKNDSSVRQSYISMRPSRQRDADYRLVKQPDFYFGRVLRNLGQDVDFSRIRSMNDFVVEVRKKLAESPPGGGVEVAKFEYANKLINRILDRRGKIVLVNFPTSGLVREIDESRWPRAMGWDRFAASTRAPTIHFMDYPELQFELPDGSHLDVKDKVAFTTALSKIVMAVGGEKLY